MDFNAIMQMITTVGFPIVMCGAMGWYVKYITDKNREDMKATNDKHSAEMNDIATALNNNTMAIQKLTDYIQTKKGVD